MNESHEDSTNRYAGVVDYQQKDPYILLGAYRPYMSVYKLSRGVNTCASLRGNQVKDHSEYHFKTLLEIHVYWKNVWVMNEWTISLKSCQKYYVCNYECIYFAVQLEYKNVGHLQFHAIDFIALGIKIPQTSVLG